MDKISPLDYEFLDGEVLILKDKMVKARKTGLCDHCMGEVKSGTHYRYMVCKLDGAINSLKYCEDCCAAMVRELEDKGENKWLSERFKKYQKDYIECQFDIPMAEYPPLTEEEVKKYSGLVEVAKRCKTCLHWAKYKHECTNVEYGDYMNMDKNPSSANIHVTAADDHGLNVCFQTGENFGCVNWKGE